MMSAQCPPTSAFLEALENVVLVCSSFLRASTWGRQSMNSCSSGWHRKPRSGKTGWSGCRDSPMEGTVNVQLAETELAELEDWLGRHCSARPCSDSENRRRPPPCLLVSRTIV